MNIRQSRQIWRRAHPVRLPSRDTPPHLELAIAYQRDKDRLKRLEEELAAQIEAELEELVCG
jgi:hypothetical protein